MKSAMFRKLTSLVLVLALVLLPMAAFAEAAQKLDTLSIGNFDITIGESEPIHIDAEIKGALAQSDDSFQFENTLSSMGTPVIHLMAGMKDDVISITADNVSSVYQISIADLQKIIEQQAQGELPFDPQLLINYIAAYTKLLGKVSTLEPEKQNSIEAFKAAGVEMQQKPEAAEVMGEQMELTRYDFSMDAAALDKLLFNQTEKVPEIAEFLDAYIAMLSALPDSGMAQLQIDKEHLLTSLLKGVGGDIRADCTLWTDEQENNMRMELTETMIMGAGENQVEIALPLTMMQKTDADGSVHMQMDMDMQPAEDGRMTMNMLFNGTEEKGDVQMTMKIVDGAQIVDMKYGMDFTKDSLNMSMLMNADGDDVSFGMTVAPSGDASRVEMIASATEDGEALFSGKLGFDVKVGQQDLPTGSVIPEGKPVVNIVDMTEEQAKQLMSEGQMLGMMGMGALMSNPSIAKILADAQTAMQDAVAPAVSPEADAAQPEQAPALAGVPDQATGG